MEGAQAVGLRCPESLTTDTQPGIIKYKLSKENNIFPMLGCWDHSKVSVREDHSFQLHCPQRVVPSESFHHHLATLINSKTASVLHSSLCKWQDRWSINPTTISSLKIVLYCNISCVTRYVKEQYGWWKSYAQTWIADIFCMQYRQYTKTLKGVLE